MAFPAMRAQATTKKQAVEAYKEYLSKMDPNYSFSLAYIDKGSVPELIVCEYMHDVGYVYGYVKGSVSMLGGTGKSPKRLYKKTGIVTSGWKFSAGSSGETATAYYRLKKNKVQLALAEVSITRYTNGKYAKSKEFRKYKSDGSSYTLLKNKSAFSDALEDLIGSRKKVKIKYYKNTEANRKKYLK